MNIKSESLEELLDSLVLCGQRIDHDIGILPDHVFDEVWEIKKEIHRRFEDRND
jgi:hypothetical protein